MRLLAALTLVLLLAVGCEQAVAQIVPGETQADEVLQADILKLIRVMQMAYAPNCAFEILDTRRVGAEGEATLEEWVVKSCSKEVAYPVKLTPSPGGGTYFSVSTPSVYVKPKNSGNTMSPDRPRSVDGS